MEGYELKEEMGGWRYDGMTDTTERDSLLSEEGELVCDHSQYAFTLCVCVCVCCVCVCMCVFHTVPMRSDIPVGEFPDYVQEMTQENNFKRSKLAIEYQVNSH